MDMMNLRLANKSSKSIYRDVHFILQQNVLNDKPTTYLSKIAQSTAAPFHR